MGTSLDVDWVRAQFALPAGTAFFDNAGGSFTLRRVIDRTARYMRETPIQLGATHRLSAVAADRQARAIGELAELVRGDPGEIVIGPSSSALVDRLARAMAPALQPGDEIIVTDFDHEANISPWLRLADRGMEIHTWTINAASGRPELSDLESLLGPRTKLVACTHTSNILGEILPMAAIAALVHAAGARLMVDGVAYAPHRRIDPAALGADFYVCSLYKLFGPHIGLLWGRREALEALANINLAHLPADAVPYKFQPGGVPYELVYGAAGIPDYLVELGNRVTAGGGSPVGRAFAAIAAHEALLGERLIAGLNALAGVRWHGPAHAARDRRLPIYSFTVRGRASRQIVTALDGFDVAVRYGNFHSARLMSRLGLNPDDGVVRVSMAHYNTTDEVDRLVGAIAQVLGA